MKNDHLEQVEKNGDANSETIIKTEQKFFPGTFLTNGKTLCILTFFPCIGSFLFGMDFGLTAWLLVNIESNSNNGMKWFEIVGDSDLGRGVVGSSSPFGMAVGCLFATLFAERVGRKGLMIISALCYTTGCSLSCLSGDVRWDNASGFCLLLAGRLFYGLGNTFSMISVPAYISELLPSHLRGTLLSFMELFIVIGVTIGFWVCGLRPFRVAQGWRYYFGIPLTFAMVMLFGVLLLPRSPRWLIMNKGSVKDITKSLRFVNPEATEDDARNLIWENRRASGRKNATLFQQIEQGGAVTIAWKVSVLLVTFQLLTGQYALLYYSGLLFSDNACGIDASWGLSLIGVTKLAGALACTCLVEEVGRRKLLVASSFGMAVGVLALALDFLTKLAKSAATGPICVGILVFFFLLYIFSYSFGLGPVTWIMLGELYPVDVKSEASSWVLVIASALNVFVTLMVPIVVKFWSFLGVFVIFFAFCCIGTFLMYLLVPETKGLTLEEIQNQLETKAAEPLANLLPKEPLQRYCSFKTQYDESKEDQKSQRRNTHTYESTTEDSPLIS